MRRSLDFYETDPAQVALLRSWVTIRGTVYEPCSGDGAIARQFEVLGHVVVTNDLDPARETMTHTDAREYGYHLSPDSVWVVTNPPFSQAYPILLNARRQGVRCAFLLRLSFLEPTQERGAWLAEYPPGGVLVLPRHSFTGDGRTDSVTCAWMLWGAEPDPGQPRVRVAPPRPGRKA